MQSQRRYARAMDSLALGAEVREALRQVREESWARFGRQVTFYLPGMFRDGAERGLYPAVSLTGDACALRCDHCRGSILRDMPAVATPEALVEKGMELARAGMRGLLVTGGSDIQGALPWGEFLDGIAHLKRHTTLKISIHSGVLDGAMARRLKDAGVDQALVDVVGSAETLREVCHLPPSLELVQGTLEALFGAGLDVVPHVVVGLHYGKMAGEERALRMIAPYRPRAMVLVVIMPLKGTAMEEVGSPDDEDIAKVFIEARRRLPDSHISLGCARPRGRASERIELIALDAGFNRMALPSETAQRHAARYGLSLHHQKTCCSHHQEEN